MTNLDEVTLVVGNDDDNPHPTPTISVDHVDHPDGPAPKPKPLPKPRHTADHDTKFTPPPKPRVEANARPKSGMEDGSNRTSRPVSHDDRDGVDGSMGHNSSAPEVGGPGGPTLPPQHGEWRLSSNTLSDLKQRRSNSRDNLLDAAVQNMFLEAAHGPRQAPPQRQPTIPHPYHPPQPQDKGKNGHNNNNNSAMHYSAQDGQLRRFVAPTNAPVVGGDDKNNSCCVIL